MLRMMRRWLLVLLVPGLMPIVGLAQAPGAYAAPSLNPVTDMLYPAGIATRRGGDGSAVDANDSLLQGDPLLDGPRVSNLGWFADAELGFFAPHVDEHLNAPVTAGLGTDTVRLPAAPLHWTVSPRVEFGYRFSQAAGELLISYRFLGSSGSTTLPAFDPVGGAALRSRLNLNIVDLDYGSQENALLPGLDMKWRVGVRTASVFFDSEAQGTVVQQHQSDFFAGVGPHAMLELWRPLWNRRVGLYSRVDGASVLGTVTQHFEETVLTPAGAPASALIRQDQHMATFMLGVEAGFAWTPNDTWRISAGYSYLQWWDVGFAGNSRANVLMQGLFLRGEWKY